MLRNKTIKKIIVTILTFILTLSVNFFGCDASSCGINPYGTGKGLFTDEYFIYWVGFDEDRAGVLGLTELGRQQEILVVPEFFDGNIPVTQIGGRTSQKNHVLDDFGEDYLGFNSECIKRIYIPFSLETVYMDFVGDTTSADLIAILDMGKYYSDGQSDNGIKTSFKTYRTLMSERLKGSYLSESQMDSHKQSLQAANVGYFYNYDNAPLNGYYWIDDYDDALISYIPKNPIREGYVFGGWYKEPECINKWDFNKDKVPKKAYAYVLREDINREILVYEYVETKLYAKWE